MVLDRIFEINSVIITPRTITPVSKSVEKTDWKGPATTPAKNMAMIAIRVGNAPPHKEKQNCSPWLIKKKQPN